MHEQLLAPQELLPIHFLALIGLIGCGASITVVCVYDTAYPPAAPVVAPTAPPAPPAP